VNVHPSKTEVRFRHQSFVHDFVRDAIRERLIETRPAPAFSPAASAQPGRAHAVFRVLQMLENEAARSKSSAAGIRPASRPSRTGQGSAAARICVAPGGGARAAPGFRRRRHRAGGAAAPACGSRMPETHGVSRRRAAGFRRVAGSALGFAAAGPNPRELHHRGRAATACGLSISTWRTSAFCLSGC
jgi:hypothetical protein